VLLALPVPLILGLFLAASWRLVDRQALQLVTLGLGAEPPRREGEPHHCRSCGGPLPAPGNEVLVECPFCSVENVFGFDLRHALGKALHQVRSLEHALRERRARRLAWAGPAAIGMLLALGAGYALVQTARAEFVSSSLSVCFRIIGPRDTSLDPYTCDRTLERNDPVSGREVKSAVLEGNDCPYCRLVVRKIAPGADPGAGIGGVDLVDDEDYAAFAVRRDGFAYLYVDSVFTLPASSGPTDAGDGAVLRPEAW
jgi:hypothetical protein